MSRKERIHQLLSEHFSIVELDVGDFSHEHNVPADGESHLKVKIVAHEFAGKSPVQRHRMVYSVLRKELDGGLHALQLQTLTPDSANQEDLETPKCRGGEK